MTQVTIKPWPFSQYCMDCEHGEFVESKTFNSSNYICLKNKLGDPDEYCQKIINEISKAIGSKLKIFKKRDWINLIKKIPSKLEIIFFEDFEYLDVGKDINSYLEEVFKKESLKKIEDKKLDMLKEKGKYFMELFNNNLKYAAFSIFILQKREYLEERELFLSKPKVESI